MSLLLLILFPTFLQAVPPVVYTTGLTSHFIAWLNDTASYEPYDFAKPFFPGGSFGGRDTNDTPIVRRPVVFVHGTGDSLIGPTPDHQGFKATIEYFLSQGYTKAELYGSQWGYADTKHEFQHIHQPEYVMYVRKFIQAVLEYTNATQIDVIAHSMGVTLSRRAIKGGWSYVEEYPYFIGPALTNRIMTYIGIAGGNYGSPLCAMEFHLRTMRMCNKLNGFYPGSKDEEPWPQDMSKFILEINTNPAREAENAFALFSMYDYVAPARIYSRYMSEFPTMNRSFIFNESQYTHVGVRDLTTVLQYNLVTYQSDEPKFSTDFLT